MSDVPLQQAWGPPGGPCENGSSSFVCASPCRPRTPTLEGDTPARRGVSRPEGASTHPCVASWPFCVRVGSSQSRRGRPRPMWVSPRCVANPLRGGGCASPAFVAAPSAVATHSSSIAHPCVLITCYCARVVPGSCRVRHLCAGFRSLVFVNISARLVLCIFVCATCFPEKGSRVRGWPLLSPRRETGWGGMNAARSPPPRLFGASSRPSRLREEKGGPQRR